MSEIATPPVASGPPSDQADELEVVNLEGRPGFALKRDQLGLTALFFCIATAAAPLTALLFNVPVITVGSGWAVPAAFIVVTVTLLIFAIGFVEISKRITGAGNFYSFVSHGFGRTAGLTSASVIGFAYPVLSASLVGVFAYFAHSTIEAWTGLSVPIFILLFGLLAVNIAFLYFDIKITARVLGVFFVAEVIGALAFALIILFQGGADGLSAAPLNPVNLFDNKSAIAVFGAAAPGIALFGAFWSYVGFEMGPSYGEETREPTKVFAKATFGTLIILGVLYTLVSYAFVIGYGPSHVAQGVAAQFNGDVDSAYYPLIDRYAGAFLKHIFELLIVTSAFACQIAFFNTSSRYVFSLGRDGVIPSVFGRTSEKHQTPVAAGALVTAFVGAIVLGFYVYDSSVEGALLKLGTWVPLVGVLGVLAVQAAVSFAIVRYFWVFDREHLHWFKTVTAPILSGLIQIGVAYLLISNAKTLGGVDNTFIKLVPWFVVAFALIGFGAGLYFKARDRKRWDAVGRFVFEGA
jgi:amino acid transporter